MSGRTNAYRSVLSATGSLAMAGASRWDDMSYLTPRSSRPRRRVQAHGELGVTDDKSVRADEKRDLARGEVSDVRHERAGCISGPHPSRRDDWELERA